jgi:hypothetical protein
MWLAFVKENLHIIAHNSRKCVLEAVNGTSFESAWCELSNDMTHLQ